MAHHGPVTAKQEIDAIVTGPSSPNAIRRRLTAVQWLQEDIARFVRWPALEASLAADAARLRAELQRRCGE